MHVEQVQVVKPAELNKVRITCQQCQFTVELPVPLPKTYNVSDAQSCLNCGRQYEPHPTSLRAIVDAVTGIQTRAKRLQVDVVFVLPLPPEEPEPPAPPAPVAAAASSPSP
jgi:hypothetical protein